MKTFLLVVIAWIIAIIIGSFNHIAGVITAIILYSLLIGRSAEKEGKNFLLWFLISFLLTPIIGFIFLEVSLWVPVVKSMFEKDITDKLEPITSENKQSYKFKLPVIKPPKIILSNINLPTLIILSITILSIIFILSYKWAWSISPEIFNYETKQIEHYPFDFNETWYVWIIFILSQLVVQYLIWNKLKAN